MAGGLISMPLLLPTLHQVFKRSSSTWSRVASAVDATALSIRVDPLDPQVYDHPSSHAACSCDYSRRLRWIPRFMNISESYRAPLHRLSSLLAYCYYSRSLRCIRRPVIIGRRMLRPAAIICVACAGFPSL